MRILAPLLACVAAFAQMPQRPVRTVTDPGTITTRQTITPAGLSSVFSGRVHGVTFGASSAEVWVLGRNKVYQLDWKSNRVVSEASLGGAAGLQAIQYSPANHEVIAAASISDKVQLLSVANNKTNPIAEGLARNQAGALALCLKTGTALIPLIDENQAALVDTKSGRLLQRIDVGVVPFGAVMDSEGLVAYVSNWGGRRAADGDLVGLMGFRANAGRVVVDQRGIASTGTVTKVDLRTGKTLATVTTGLHPTAMAWDEKKSRLYVANGNQDSVSVIDTKTDRVINTLSIKPFKETAFGVAPTALALSRDGGTVYVACGGLNAVAVLDTSTGKLSGMIPTAWYPNGLSLSPDGKFLAISTLLGVGMGPQAEDLKKRIVQAARGSISVLPVPDAAELASFTTAVAENNHLTLGAPGTARKPDPNAKPAPIPARAGEPSLIEHVVFIIKENRTYDQVLGDIGKGNSDPSLTMFGRDVTPNQHKLAEQFVLLDNLYAVGGNSADGHQWLTQANETDYCLWPGYQGRSYPFDGSDPIAYSSSGFLWDAALRMKKTVRVYGEFAGITAGWDRQKLLTQWRDGTDFTNTFHTVAPLAPLNNILAANYPAYSTQIPDVVRAKIFLADVERWQQDGKMPNLTIMALPSNHTNGAQPDSSTPKAMVADNDLALGQMVEALSHSRFWPKMAIFIVEDDAQNGVDHVDGHRTVGLVISPYVKRGAIDSTFYSQASMVKSIELILGLPTMSLFDLIANGMHPSFTNTADSSPFTHLEPKQSLYERNPPLKAMRGQQRRDARASLAMRFDIPDAAPTEKLNRILWRSAMGINVRYPRVRHSIFSPMAVYIDDDDR